MRRTSGGTLPGRSQNMGDSSGGNNCISAGCTPGVARSSISCAKIWNTYGWNSCTSSDSTTWKAGNSCAWNRSSSAGSAAAPKRTSAAALSKRKWLNPGWVGFRHTCSSMSASSFSAVGATGAIWGPTKVIRRITHFMTYSFSALSGCWNAPNRPWSSGSSCTCRSDTAKRGCPPSLRDSSRSMQVAAYEWTTFESDPSSRTRPGNAARASALGIWDRKVVRNFSASAFSTGASFTSAAMRSGAMWVR
mmetsp:Transcript_13409/g.40539  ORF Transcript_13409/g.40539 Transcript_13409/m.40539 type:complete len:248 (-) Transcript_13409:780-1523(-)